MQYIVIAYDGKDKEALSRRLAVRQEHLKLSDEMIKRGELHFGVAILDDAEKMIGSVMVAEFPSRKELDAWLGIEPYVTGKVWETIEVLPGRVGPSFTK